MVFGISPLGDGESTPARSREEGGNAGLVRRIGRRLGEYRGTSPIRNRAPFGPYSGTMPRALWCPRGGTFFYERGTPAWRQLAGWGGYWQDGAAVGGVGGTYGGLNVVL